MPYNVSRLQQPRIWVFNEPTLGLEIMYYAKTRCHELVCPLQISGCLGGRSRAAILSAVRRAPNNVKIVLRIHSVVPCSYINNVRGAKSVVPVHLHNLPSILAKRHADGSCPRAEIQQTHLRKELRTSRPESRSWAKAGIPAFKFGIPTFTQIFKTGIPTFTQIA